MAPAIRSLVLLSKRLTRGKTNGCGHVEQSGPCCHPASAGVGLRAPHYRDILATRPQLGWFEAHSENYFGEGGQPLVYLTAIRADYPVSFHGVGLSLGSVDPLSVSHLKKLKRLIDSTEPCFVSEHLSWSSVEGQFFNELLPLPYSEAALQHLVSRVQQMQDALARQVLIENITAYVTYHDSQMPEWEFLNQLTQITGCGLLLDINNVYVNSINHEFDPHPFLNNIRPDSVAEIHLAGFAAAGDMLIDTHGACVSNEVWALYETTICRIGVRPTLIEWDNDIPPLSTLLHEAARAQTILDQAYDLAA